jgi:chemosensory pili system protein ChpA (sensor histidine kinase/response regulator)
MNTNTKLNIASVIGVRDGIDQIFSLINEYLESYSQNTEKTGQLELCRGYVHQLNGLLEMLELNNVAIISNKMEKLIDALIHQQITPEPLALKALRQTADALMHYLYELIDGTDGNPMRLFPAYRNLMQAQGVKNVSESDLFYANLVSEPPLQGALPNSEPAEIITIAKQARTEYQAGLLKWLRDSTNQDSLQQMIKAIGLIEKLPGSTEQRSFWWVCTGFLENLLEQKTTIDLPMRRLCGKVEQEIRRLAENKPATTDKILQEILYHITQSEFDSERIRDIKRTYELQGQPAPVDEQTSAQQIEEEKKCESALHAMRETLKEINDNWGKFYAGNQETQPSLLKNIEKLKASAAQIKFPPLQKLIGVMGGSVTYLRIRPQDMNEDVAVEITTALLLIENVITDFHKLPAEFSRQVETLSMRLRMITTGKQQEKSLPDIPGPDEIEYKTQEKKSQRQATQEILANLGQIEGILDKFFVDPTMRSDLQKLSSLFKQTTGALVMLNLGRANTLLDHCQKLVNKFLQPEYKINPPEQVRLADGLSSLGFYIEALTSTHPDNDKILETALALFNNDLTPETVTPISTATASPMLVEEPNTEEITKEIDPELLDTFLAESDDVLQDIEESLAICQNNPSNNAPLATLRRGFHTLKGSGRMVELHDLSEVAWHMEQVLNRWLNERKPATQNLIDLVKQAHHEFKGWCDDLKKQGTANINAEKLLFSAKNFINGIVPETTAKDETSVSTADQDTVIHASHDLERETGANITIGDLIITRDLFDVFTAEARQHFTTLKHESDRFFECNDTAINHQFMLAAHTLSSTSRTLGLTFIADIASVLEQWSSLLLKNSKRPDERGLQLIQKIIECLGSMLESVNSRQYPAEADLQTANTLSNELALLIDQEKQRAEAKSTDLESAQVIETISPDNTSSDQQAIISTQHLNEQHDTIDKLDPVLSQVFFDEARELIPEIGGKLRAWHILPQDDNIHKALLRALHTLKGSARMAGAINLGEMIHNMESGVENTINTSIVSVTMIENLEIEFDSISERIERLQHATKTEKQIATLNQIETGTSSSSSVSSSLQHTEEAAKQQVIPEKIEFSTQKTVLRVNEELIDRLLNESGEISIIRSKVEAQLYNFKQSLLDLTESAERLRGQLREVEIQAESQMQSHLAQPQEDEQTFDPLEFDRFTRFQELTRLMAESVDDVVTVQQNLRATHNVAEEAVTQQALMSRQLQQALMQIRTVPFGNVAEHFYRIVRQEARELDKKASLSIQGDEVEIDRSVLEKINSPIDHLLRNAVAHGIEEPAKRLTQGKPETGQITINLNQEGNEVIIALSDDGNGLDLERIREEALRLELIKIDDQLNDDQLTSLIYSHGLTTLNEATGTAGRGIGMDVVKNEITSLGGRIEILTEIGKGTTFRIYLPLTLTVAQTLLVRAGESTYAVPTVIVKHVQELNADELNEAYANQFVKFNEKNCPFTYLLHLFGEPDRPPKINRHNRILILQSETYQLAVHVDELIGNSEVVVKNIGPQMAHAPGVEGATVMGDGEIILIINPVKLMQRDEVKKLFITPPSAQLTSIDSKPAFIPTIMVVDDSLTVRKVTSRLLEREGCEVLIAKDGVGAINLLRETIPDVMLVDLEMPHMNGFELIRNVRNNPDTKNIPIIIISSRTADKHRKMANELGVNGFLGKPYNEDELLSHITRHIKQTS